MLENAPPVFRFAPSPNGALHLGHAYSALLNQKLAREKNAKFLLRLEDIDRARCTPQLEEEMCDILRWLGIEWDGEPRRQSDHFEAYQDALETLQDAGLIYEAFMTRGEIRRQISEFEERGKPWPTDPDGSPLYPGKERSWSEERRRLVVQEKPLHTLRLDMKAALEVVGGDLIWQESGAGPDGETEECLAAPSIWGDVILARSDTPTSYHLSVVVDDALQGITHIVRGRDLFHATSIHRVLQTLLGLPVPAYHHHDLILDDDGRKLSKSAGDTSLASLQRIGMTPDDIRKMVGLA